MKTLFVVSGKSLKLTYGAMALITLLAVSMAFSPWVSASQTPESIPSPVEVPAPTPTDPEPVVPANPEPVVPAAPEPIVPVVPVEPVIPEPVEPVVPEPVVPEPVEPVVPEPVVPEPVEPVVPEPVVPEPVEPVVPEPVIPEPVEPVVPEPVESVDETGDQDTDPKSTDELNAGDGAAEEDKDPATPTEEPSPPATPEPTQTPEPTPTPEPAIPFDPAVACVSSPGSVAPVAGDTEWSYLDCTAAWETRDVSGASLLPVKSTAGWEIVPLNDRAKQDPNQMILDPQPLNLVDTNPGEDKFAGSRFHIAMRVSCVDESAVTIPLQFQATSGEDALREVATEELPINATAATLPDVTLTSAVFEDASPPNGTAVSTGVISMNYNNASENCGWNITTVVDDFVADDDVMSASELSLIEVSGPVGLTSSITEGEVIVHAAPGVSMPTSGTISITVSMPVPGTISSGVYSTTISAKASAP